MGRRASLRGVIVKRLLALAVSFALAGFALAGWLQRPRDLLAVLIWFAAAIVLHDLVVLPLYSALDHLTIRRLPGQAAAYIRVPTIISALLLVVLFPTVSGFGRHSFHAISGLQPADYLLRWLAVCGLLFLGSAVLYAWRRRRVISRPARQVPRTDPDTFERPPTRGE
jgi:hypothetical protein